MSAEAKASAEDGEDAPKPAGKALSPQFLLVLVNLVLTLSAHGVFVYTRILFQKPPIVEDVELKKKKDKHDADRGLIFEAIRQLMEPPPEKPKRRIGFHHD